MPIPHANERLADWIAARRRAGRMLVAIDFDGTISDIVPRPGDAVLLPAAADALRQLAARPDTDVAVVSGRALADVRSRVGIDEVYYAGNHGLEIEGPGVSRIHTGAAAARPRLEICLGQLRRSLDSAGVDVEDKGLSLSIHYRRAPDPDAAGARIRSELDALCAGDEQIRITAGKRVFEVRPRVDWDKGRATRFLRQSLHAAHGSLVPALFLGDDVTDEDAFREVADEGAGIIVASEPPAHTAAVAFVRTPAEAAALLAALAA